jgi:hypothetical protein
MTTELFLIITTICVIIVTVLLATLIIICIKILLDAREAVQNVNHVSQNVSKAFTAVISIGSVVSSPASSVVKKIFRKKKKKND